MSVKLAIKNALAYLEYRVSIPVYGLMALIVGRYQGSGHALITAPGQGNIGDQAMLEAVLENAEDHVYVVVRRPEDIFVPARRSENVSVISLPNLIYGSFNLQHIRDVWRLLGLLRQCNTLSLIGADIMDGAYNPRASVRRATLLVLAKRLHLDARVLGFSWNGRASWPALAALRKASSMNVRLMLRDPVSAERARRDGLSNVTEVSDLVFSASDSDERLVDELALGNKPVALVNISGHIEKFFPQHDEYSKVIENFVRAGFHVVLVPHVSRPGSDDLPIMRRMYETFGHARISFIDRVCTPSEIRGLCRRARIVVTGRMHLSIIALSQGVPAVVLSSQGKVEGLQQRLPQFARCVEPDDGFARVVIKEVEALLSNRQAENPEAMIFEQRRLSLMNFQ